MNVQWIDRKDTEMPFDNDNGGIMVSHKYGVEYIVWHRRAWRYAYTGQEIGELIDKITHWCKPDKAY